MREENLVECALCGGSPWIFRLKLRDNANSIPVVYPCPNCNPHGDRPPMEVDMKEIDTWIEERKKIIPKEEKK